MSCKPLFALCLALALALGCALIALAQKDTTPLPPSKDVPAEPPKPSADPVKPPAEPEKPPADPDKPKDDPARPPDDPAAAPGDAAPDHAPEPAPENSGADTTNDSVEAGATTEGTEGTGTAEEVPEEEKEPEGVRRRRPDSADEEREYKKRRTREDPFLTAPQASDKDSFYNPADWLRYDLAPEISRYLVQDRSGKVLGNLSQRIVLESHPTEGELVHLSLAQDFAPHASVELWAFASNLKPRRVVKDCDDAAPDAPGRLTADYAYDRLVITRKAGDLDTQQRMRALPYSFDYDELPLLVRQLRFTRGEWPFEAAISLPVLGKNAPLLIELPQQADITAADGVSYHCYLLKVRASAENWTYWVERSRPNRLVKFSDGEKTWTLSDYRAGD